MNSIETNKNDCFKNINEEETTGTTILAFKYKDGIMVAADSRTTTGQIISCHYTNKIDQKLPNMLICRSGSAAHTSFLVDLAVNDVKKNDRE